MLEHSCLDTLCVMRTMLTGNWLMCQVPSQAVRKLILYKLGVGHELPVITLGLYLTSS